MKEIALVGLGGALGSASRYLLGMWISRHYATAHFPLPTFAINVLGCLVIGVLAGLASRLNGFGDAAKLFLFTGVLGGFTTFSSFGLETFNLLRRGETMVAASYVVLSVVCGLLLVWAGFKVAAG